MDAVGRKTFWDTLCSLHTYDYESANIAGGYGIKNYAVFVL